MGALTEELFIRSGSFQKSGLNPISYHNQTALGKEPKVEKFLLHGPVLLFNPVIKFMSCDICFIY